MKRLLLDEVERWYEDSNRKPLLLCGARQVGKTYLLRNQFARKFRNHVFIDFLKDEESRRFFSGTCDPQKYLEYIEARFDRKISNRGPLIMDDVQE